MRINTILPTVNHHCAAPHSHVNERISHALPRLRRQPQRRQRIPLNEANKQPLEVVREHELISRRRDSGNSRQSRRIRR